jgi:hypothetical protein
MARAAVVARAQSGADVDAKFHMALRLEVVREYRV